MSYKLLLVWAKMLAKLLRNKSVSVVLCIVALEFRCILSQVSCNFTYLVLINELVEVASKLLKDVFDNELVLIRDLVFVKERIVNADKVHLFSESF